METLIRLMSDDADEVRKEVATVASILCNHPLQPFVKLLTALIDSPSYVHALTQLLFTLEHAPDKIDDLILKASQRFLSVFGNDAADIRTGATGHARYVSKLVVRGLAQCQSPTHRAVLLDVLDQLLELGVYGVNDAIEKSERI